jgi:hypothetical protein
MDRKITAIFGFDLANVIWQPFWPILMADLLLHNFLHLLMYDAAQTD